jgi:hypothetical protein
MYCSGRKLGSRNALISTDNAGPFAGEGPRPRTFGGANSPGKFGRVGIGGAVASKSAGRLLKRVEYLRLTRSEVYLIVRNAFALTPDSVLFIPFHLRSVAAVEEELQMMTSLLQYFAEH